MLSLFYFTLLPKEFIVEGAEMGEDWGGGVPIPNRLGDPRERRELPQRGTGLGDSRQRIFGIFKARRTLLVEKTVLLHVPAKSVFTHKNPLNRRLGAWFHPLPLSGYAPGSHVIFYIVCNITVKYA